MKKLLVKICLLLLVCGIFGGCTQKVVYREFFEPKDGIKIEREDGSIVGATKSEATKDGSPNWSDNKSFSLRFF